MQRASLLLARAALPLAIVGTLSAGCVDKPAPAADPKAHEQQNDTVMIDPEPPADPNSLSAEELELIAADPKSLTPEQNRKRGFALRKQIMAKPDSPAAKSLEEAREAVLNGELQLPGEEKKDPGLVIELPEHLKDQRVSKGDPAQ
jgi:hypothetical protein